MEVERIVSAILLGAGESKRMGVNKLALPWGGENVLEHCLRTLLQSKVKEVVVVLNDRTRWEVDHARDPRIKVVNNPYYRKGMSTSVRMGLQAIDPKSFGILIALGDQPFLKTRTINAMIDEFTRKRDGIVVPTFRGEKGHPVIFHRRYLKELLTLRGDVGGRSIMEKHVEDVRSVRVKSKGVIKDIDTWEDYRKEVRRDDERQTMNCEE
jgi:molybdenum cofactor cytidylyltransferase